MSSNDTCISMSPLLPDIKPGMLSIAPSTTFVNIILSWDIWRIWKTFWVLLNISIQSTSGGHLISTTPKVPRISSYLACINHLIGIYACKVRQIYYPGMDAWCPMAMGRGLLPLSYPHLAIIRDCQMGYPLSDHKKNGSANPGQ